MAQSVIVKPSGKPASFSKARARAGSRGASFNVLLYDHCEGGIGLVATVAAPSYTDLMIACLSIAMSSARRTSTLSNGLCVVLYPTYATLKPTPDSTARSGFFFALAISAGRANDVT